MIIFLIIFSVICVLIIIGLVYALKNILKKYELLESNEESKDIWIYNFQQTVDFLNNKLKEIDKNGSFASDDEVGIFFKELKNMQELLNKKFISDK